MRGRWVERRRCPMIGVDERRHSEMFTTNVRTLVLVDVVSLQYLMAGGELRLKKTDGGGEVDYMTLYTKNSTMRCSHDGLCVLPLL